MGKSVIWDNKNNNKIWIFEIKYNFTKKQNLWIWFPLKFFMFSPLQNPLSFFYFPEYDGYLDIIVNDIFPQEERWVRISSIVFCPLTLPRCVQNNWFMYGECVWAV